MDLPVMGGRQVCGQKSLPPQTPVQGVLQVVLGVGWQLEANSWWTHHGCDISAKVLEIIVCGKKMEVSGLVHSRGSSHSFCVFLVALSASL